MKCFVFVTLALMIGSGPLLAQSGQCRQIQSRKERNACYERQEAARKAQNPARAKMNDQIDQMQLEEQRLSRRLQGICRGC